MRDFLLKALISLCLGVIAYVPISWGVADYVVNAHLETLNRRVDDVIAETGNMEGRLESKMTQSLSSITCKVFAVELDAQRRQIERKLFESVISDLEPESQLLAEISAVHKAYFPALKDCEEAANLGWFAAVHNSLTHYASSQFEAALSFVEELPKTAALYHYLAGALHFNLAADVTLPQTRRDRSAKHAMARAEDAFRIAKSTLGFSANSFSIRKLRCNILGMRSTKTEAEVDYTAAAVCYQSLVSEKQNGWVYYNIAAALAAAGNHEAALKPLHQAVASSARICQKHIMDPNDGKEFQGALRGHHAETYRTIAASIEAC